jgi:hypothetical protein
MKGKLNQPSAADPPGCPPIAAAMPYLGAKGDATAREERRCAATTTSIACTLLGIGLLATTAHLSASEGAGCSLQPVKQELSLSQPDSLT